MKTHYSSHLQLQYLMNKHGIDQNKLFKELSVYYNSLQWELKTTKSGKVTEARRRTKAELIALIPPPPPPPTVIVKKRRVAVKPIKED